MRVEEKHIELITQYFLILSTVASIALLAELYSYSQKKQQTRIFFRKLFSKILNLFKFKGYFVEPQPQPTQTTRYWGLSLFTPLLILTLKLTSTYTVVDFVFGKVLQNCQFRIFLLPFSVRSAKWKFAHIDIWLN